MGTRTLEGHTVLLLKGGHVFSPEDLGTRDLLIGGGKIIAVDEKIEAPQNWSFVKVVDASDLWVLPGLIDEHVHIIGGGGEGGPETRNRDILLGQIITAGVTTVVGCIGVDCETRTVQTLLAKARALQLEGISAYILTGGYVLPTPTLTGSITSDIAFIPDILGVGEIAIADHRSSQPTFEELAKIGGAARMGGLLGKKAGLFVLHVGNGLKGISQLMRLVQETEIPVTQFLPTHVNRNGHLFAQAIEYAKLGGLVEVTAGIAPHLGFPEAVKPSKAIVQMLDAGVNLTNITMSSDANGNMPVFDPEGNVIGLEVQAVTHLYSEFRDLVQAEGLSVDQALRPITTNPARLLRLGETKGQLAVGSDADVLLVQPDLSIHSLYAKGQAMIENGKQRVVGMYEQPLQDRLNWAKR